MEYQNRKTQSSPGQPSKPTIKSSPPDAKPSKKNYKKPVSISIFRSEDFESTINSALKTTQGNSLQIFSALKLNEPTPTFPQHHPNDLIWDERPEEVKIEQVKNGKISEIDEFDNISVIEKENTSGLGGLSGDMPAFFDLKNSGDQNDCSSEAVESKVDVMVGMSDINTSSFVIPGSQDLSILPENNVTIVMNENPTQTVSSSSKDKKKFKIKAAKIPKMLPGRWPELKTRNPKLKQPSTDSISKLRQMSESRSSINIKSKHSLSKRPLMMNLSSSSKKLLPKMKTKQVFSSTLKQLSPLALSLSNTPYLQEFKKTVMSSLIPSKKPLEDPSGLIPVKKLRTKKRIQIF